MNEGHREIDLNEPGAAAPPVAIPAAPVTAQLNVFPGPGSWLSVVKMLLPLIVEASVSAAKPARPDVIGGRIAGGPPGLERR